MPASIQNLGASRCAHVQQTLSRLCCQTHSGQEFRRWSHASLLQARGTRESIFQCSGRQSKVNSVSKFLARIASKGRKCRRHKCEPSGSHTHTKRGSPQRCCATSVTEESARRMSPVSLCSRLPLQIVKKRPQAEPFNNSKELNAGQRLRSQNSKQSSLVGSFLLLAVNRVCISWQMRRFPPIMVRISSASLGGN